jgi:hypothetical protein
MSILEYFDATAKQWFFYMEGDRRAEDAKRWRLDGAHEGTREACEEVIRGLIPRWRSR